jgi:hypothetical protein
MRTSSKNAILGIVVAASAMAATSASRAQSYPWCLVLADKAGAWNCSFVAREQCMASAGGNFGSCIQNPSYAGPQLAPARRYRTNG